MPIAGKTKQEVMSEFRCSEILEAARKVFAKKGFDEATMDEIAAAAGLAKGTLYLYFKSKRDVYLKTLQHGRAELLERVRTNMLAVEGLRAKIRSLIATRVKYSEENGDFYKIYLTEFSNIIHPASINAEFRDLQFKQAKMLEQALTEGIERGEIRQLRVEPLAFVVQDMTRSLITRRLLGWSKTDLEEDIDFLCDLIWTGIAR
jgi:AcrR family transcriptional regulator